VYHYTLENNISIDFKPNSNNKNLLELQAFSDGGFSILKGRKLRLSKFTTDVVTESAPGRWNNITLKKIMTGKQAEVSVFIERFAEKIEARCNTKDMETMFELLYARIAEPKVDVQVLENMKRIFKEHMMQLRHNPQYRLMQDVISVYYGDDPELTPLKPEEIETFEAQEILSLYKERFSDMNRFHFTVSGDVTPEQIEPLLVKYLANLPTQQKDETHGTTLPLKRNLSESWGMKR